MLPEVVNLPNLIVTHNLGDQALAQSLIEVSQLTGSVIPLSGSSYVVSTDHSASDVFEQLSNLIDTQDSIYVISLAEQFAAQGPPEANEWFSKNF